MENSAIRNCWITISCTEAMIQLSSNKLYYHINFLRKVQKWCKIRTFILILKPCGKPSSNLQQHFGNNSWKGKWALGELIRCLLCYLITFAAAQRIKSLANSNGSSLSKLGIGPGLPFVWKTCGNGHFDKFPRLDPRLEMDSSRLSDQDLQKDLILFKFSILNDSTHLFWDSTQPITTRKSSASLHLPKVPKEQYKTQNLMNDKSSW